ncbi:LEA type 2 family protein [Chryseosolibacter indicus]|uniref:LEA type 2 family protein n=1 Tax=Chryseosolibacter indicus TaxID=2782351 RepID=A0ABS5VQA4_9BACT|nr:LEA type 2 family protein [Chryseosolibacter indicus]MBT1703034.1 LEA type 2 family protein [Chryseosolibacter indicus]
MKSLVIKAISGRFILLVFVFTFSLLSCERPKEEIILRQIKDVVADASSDPMLKAEAVFYNPNNISGRLKNINVEIFVNGRKAGVVDKDYKVKIPANGEFSVPLEVKLNMKELGGLQTLLGVIGGKKFDIQYVGKIKLSYRGVPFKVPVDYKSKVRLGL